MKLQIRVDDNGIISDVKFKTFGCGSAIASSSYMTERVMGLSLEEAEKIKNTEIAKELCLPPVKLHCSSKSTFLPPTLTASHHTPSIQCLQRTRSGQPSVTIAQSAAPYPTRSSLVSSMSPRARPPAKQ